MFIVNKRLLLLIGQIVLAAAIPLSLIFSNVWYITNSEWLYSYGWWRNGIVERSAISIKELNSASDQIKTYFNDSSVFLDVRVIRGPETISLYNQREILHMVDVKNLIRGVRDIGIISGIVSGALLITGFFVLRSRFPTILRQTLLGSAALTVLVLTTLGIAMVVNFRWVFTQFHFISFANDLWLLNPSRDFLIIMFPQRFFFEAALFIAGLTVLEFVAVLAVGILLGRVMTKKLAA